MFIFEQNHFNARAGQGLRVVVDNSGVRLVETSSQVLLSSCQTHCVGNTLAEGTCTGKAQRSIKRLRKQICNC